MTFRVGMKVVCVDASPCRVWGDLPLAEGAIYTITKVNGAGRFWRRGKLTYGPCLTFHEVKSGHASGSFGHARFRPAVERETDISIFTRLLVPGSKVSEPV